MPSGAPDAVTQAANQQRGNRQAALDAIATGGRAGRAAYQAGQNDLRQAQDRAMSGMAADSYGVLNDPGSRITNATQRIGGSTFDAYGRAMGQLSSAYGANADAAAANNSNYFSQIAASAPAYRQLADEQIAEARAAWERQKAAYDAQQAASGGAGDMSKWDIEANATGLGEQMAGRALEEGQRRWDRGSAAIAAQEVPGSGEGLTGGRAIGAALTGDSPSNVEAHRAEMTRAVQAFQNEHGRAPTREEFAQIQAFVNPDRARALDRVRRGREQVTQVQETPDWAWQRAAAQAIGVPEPLATGLFTPPTPGEMVNDVQAQRQLDYLQGPGQGMFESPQAMRDYGFAQDELVTGVPHTQPLPAAYAAEQMGMDPAAASALMTHPAFGDAVDTFAQGVAAGMPIEQINADLANWYSTQSDYGHDFPTIRNLLTMMYGRLAG